MFCKRTYCALVLMMETAGVYGGDQGLDVSAVSKRHAIPSKILDGIIKSLVETGLIEVVGGKLKLGLPPDQITIWRIVKDVAGDNIFTGNYYDETKTKIPVTAVFLLNEERQSLLKMIENRLSRQKLSVWSYKASKTVYI